MCTMQEPSNQNTIMANKQRFECLLFFLNINLIYYWLQADNKRADLLQSVKEMQNSSAEVAVSNFNQ